MKLEEVFKGFGVGREPTDKKFKVTYYCGSKDKPCVRYAYGPDAETVSKEISSTLGRVWEIEEVSDD